VKLTNRLNLPQPLVSAVANDEYSRGDADISVTGLLKPPRIAALEILHADELTEDASDRIWSLFGQAMHTVLQRSNTSGIAERRLAIEVAGWKVSGSMDAYYDHGLLQDYKFVTVYKFKDGGVPEEYQAQLNIYAEILRQHGQQVKWLEIVGILRDWSKLEAARDPEYPQTQVIVRSVELWPSERVREVIEERVRLHQQARKGLPLCTIEERWEKPTKWAVMKKGASKSLKNHDTEEAARIHAAEVGASVEKRPGEATRCKAYCPVARFCTQYTGEGMFQPRSVLEAV